MIKTEIKQKIIKIIDILPDNKLEEILNYAININTKTLNNINYNNTDNKDSVKILMDIIDKYNKIEEQDLNIEDIYKNRNKMDEKNVIFD